MGIVITDIQRFCMHDGPGIRTTVFLKGCPLRCKWCHNPETHKMEKQILYYKNKCMGCGICKNCPNGAHIFDEKHRFDAFCCKLCGFCTKNCPVKALEEVGKEVSGEYIEKEVMRDSAFYGEDGGVTLSGGEPMLQAEETLKLLKRLKEKNIHTTVETCGYFDKKYIKELSECADLILWDIKDTDSKRHIENTGVSNEKIIDNLILADSLGIKTVIRCIIVNGVNTHEEHYKNIAEIYGKLKNCLGVELLAYHTYGSSKYEAVYGEENANVDWIPEKETMEEIKNKLKDYGVTVL